MTCACRDNYWRNKWKKTQQTPTWSQVIYSQPDINILTVFQYLCSRLTFYHFFQIIEFFQISSEDFPHAKFQSSSVKTVDLWKEHTHGQTDIWGWRFTYLDPKMHAKLKPNIDCKSILQSSFFAYKMFGREYPGKVEERKKLCYHQVMQESTILLQNNLV